MNPKFKNYIKHLNHALNGINANDIDKLKNLFLKKMDGNGEIIVIGNGGSAANAHHIVGDYTKTFALYNKKLRISCPADNGCYLSAVSNDLDFSEAYEILVSSRINKEDLLIFLSGSGNSSNLVKAALAAKEKSVETVSITAYNGGYLKKISTHHIHVPVDDMEMAEDAQLVIFHFVKQALTENMESVLSMVKYNKRVSSGEVV
ncbi:MAG: SIS domain-containing protein [Pelagibacteraceae bacterium TMED124]|nr:MAG: SIS domain-containing protein [Pelagibacteraceae bacterium TMED124]|tara:strand:- start:2382 stop:2993 length:612 start_codon:yes stop_codon:yes gene_type:complete